jgi:two-component system chemotaxis sensor kinase CheA
MNEFIEQFLIEARELVDQTTDDLLTLERAPGDRARLDGAFRGFHTLKGAAGIIEFEAMARALHAAEDGLSAVRANERTITAALIGDALSVLDQVVRWLDAIEASGGPPTDADAAANRLIALFSAATPQPSASAAADRWLDDLKTRHPEAAAAQTALIYTPAQSAFFEGEDPLERLRALPDLLALELIPTGEPRPLDAVDPFACRLAFAALCSAPADEIAKTLGVDPARLTLVTLDGGESGLDATARDILRAQLRMLAAAPAEGRAGRAGSAARTAASVLLEQSRDKAAYAVTAAFETGGAAGLIAALNAALEGRSPSPPAPEKAPAIAAAGETTESTVRSLRVEVERIDALVRLTDEFTVLKTGLAHLAALAAGGAAADALGEPLKARQLELDRLVSDLQHAVLHMRVLPIRQVFQRFPRLMRELGVALGKPVRLIMEGEDTEADKAIVESLFEPLLHVVRNALDHGLEVEDRRLAAGKPAVGLITLRAFRRGDEVVVEVEDDGAGIDVARVQKLAVERGLIDEATLSTLSEADIVDLVFAPGFSTARTVTTLSGRGVGMDAVRAAIGRLGGRVSLESRPGQGSTVRFTLPFTIMLSRVMTVEAGGQVFGLPTEMVIETLRLPREEISVVGAALAFAFRGRTTPLIRLSETLWADCAPASAGDALVVVASAGDQVVGLEVDRLLSQMEVMLKPMEGLLSGMAAVSGATLLGDGRVLVVLDVGALIA